MTRTNAREIAVHIIFEMSFSKETADECLAAFLTPETFALIGREEALYASFPDEAQANYISALVRGVELHGVELDGYIEKYLKGWSFHRINRVMIAILRAAMYEVLYLPDVPNSAAINEAVEIAKGYEEPEGVAFLNGVLGSFARAELPKERE